MEHSTRDELCRVARSNAVLRVLFVLSIFMAFMDPARAQLSFQSIAATAGIDFPNDQIWNVVDFNGDSLEDLVNFQPFPPALLKNNGDGTFSDVTHLWPGLTHPDATSFDWAHGWADIDNDGDKDVVINARFSMPDERKYLFFRNNIIGLGQQSFTEVFSLDSTINGKQHRYVVWGDYDNDGDVDFFAGASNLASLGSHRLFKSKWKETGSISFEDVSASVGLTSVGSQMGSAHWIDADNDGDSDLYVVSDDRSPQPQGLFYKNLLKETGTATFDEIATAIGLSASSFEGIFGDYDNDGDQDVYISRGKSSPNLLYKNDLTETGNLTFTELGGVLGVQQPSNGGAGSRWGDLDNDGDLELLAFANSNESSVLYSNNLLETGTTGFADVTSVAGLSPGDHVAMAFLFDIENDGTLEIFESRFIGGDPNRLFKNEGVSGNWLDLKLVGTDSNRDGLGARITLLANGRRQYRQHTFFAGIGTLGGREHFGLGSATVVDEIEIRWPSGCVQKLTLVSVNQILVVTELCNAPPVADAGADQIVECQSPSGALVTLDGSGSSDPDGDPLIFTWSGPFPEVGGTTTGEMPMVSLPLGMSTITLVTNDGQVDSAGSSVEITVKDTTPPGIVAMLDALGPGDEVDDDDEGRFRIGFTVSDTCDPSPEGMAVLVIPGIPEIAVSHGQVIEFEVDDEEVEVEAEDGILEIEAPSLSLKVTAVDASGNAAMAELPLTGLGADNDDDGLASAELDD